MAAQPLADTPRAGFGARHLAVVLLAIAALALPWLLRVSGFDFYLSLASRIVVYAIAATSLNLVLGYGGLISVSEYTGGCDKTIPIFFMPLI